MPVPTTLPARSPVATLATGPTLIGILGELHALHPSDGPTDLVERAAAIIGIDLVEVLEWPEMEALLRWQTGGVDPEDVPAALSWMEGLESAP